jgi:glucose-1-phosphate thymidylyltransferase
MAHRGILLAGGDGSRLYPLTASTSKQLVNVFDKPMIYYPLTTLMLAGIREILVISSPTHLPRLQAVLRDGGQWGLSVSYAEQREPRGIADALLVGEEFLGDRPSMLALGDNLLYGTYDVLRRAVAGHGEDAAVFAYHVDDPSPYGVIELDDDDRVVSLEEKPAKPRSKWAVPGLYLYPPGVAGEAAQLVPSARGELEITDLNRRYLEAGRLVAHRLGRGIAWFDAGTARELLEAANFIDALQRRQGLVVGSPEEVAYRTRFIDAADLEDLVSRMPASPYREYLSGVLDE